MTYLTQFDFFMTYLTRFDSFLFNLTLDFYFWPNLTHFSSIWLILTFLIQFDSFLIIAKFNIWFLGKLWIFGIVFFMYLRVRFVFCNSWSVPANLCLSCMISALRLGSSDSTRFSEFWFPRCSKTCKIDHNQFTSTEIDLNQLDIQKEIFN